MIYARPSRSHPRLRFTQFTRRACAVLRLCLLFGCDGSSAPRVQRGCGGSGERTPDTTSPVRRREGSRMTDGAELTWEELVGEEPRGFDERDPREPE